MFKLRTRSRNLFAALALLLALVICAGATFAWVTSKETVVNAFASDGYALSDSVVIVEEFNPDGEEIEPGSTIDKKVRAVNTGTADAFVRISFEELLNLLGDPDGEGEIYAAGDVKFDATNASAAYPSGFIPANIDASAYSAANGWTEITTDVKADSNNGSYATVLAASVSADGLHMWKMGDLIKAYYQYTVSDVKYYQSVQISTQLNINTAETSPKYSTTPVYGTNSGQNYTVTIKSAPSYGWFKWTDTSFSGSTSSFFDSWNDKNNADEWKDAYVASSQVSGKPAVTDIRHSVKSGLIYFNYGTDVSFDGTSSTAEGAGTAPTTAGVLAANKWYYNAADGYFYWGSLLPSGASTANLLEEIVFSGQLGNEFQKLDYQIAITLEAIQAKKAAITDSTGGGWNITGNSELVTYLQGLAAE